MSTRRAVTFDFHETLASCDRWFELEVRLLPAEVLARLPRSAVTGAPPADEEAVTAAYRSLRSEIVGHGLEMDALAGVKETYRRLGFAADPTAVAGVVDTLMRESLADVRAKPGAVDTVRALHDAGLAVGVVSSAVYHRFLIWVLESFAIRPLLRSVVTSASAGFYKSRPEIYQRALAELDAAADETCHVGDSPRWDHLTPRSMGIRTILVGADLSKLEPGQPLPDLSLESLVGAAPVILAAVESWSAAPAAD